MNRVEIVDNPNAGQQVETYEMIQEIVESDEDEDDDQLSPVQQQQIQKN